MFFGRALLAGAEERLLLHLTFDLPAAFSCLSSVSLLAFCGINAQHHSSAFIEKYLLVPRKEKIGELCATCDKVC